MPWCTWAGARLIGRVVQAAGTIDAVPVTPAGGGVERPRGDPPNAHPGRVVCPSSPHRRPAVAGRPRRLHRHRVSRSARDYSNNFNFPHTQSFDAINLLKSVAPAHSGDTEQVVFGTSGDASLTDPAIGQRINTMVDEINALPNVTRGARSPYDAAGQPRQHDRTSTRTGRSGSSRSPSTSRPTTSRTPRPRSSSTP